MRTFLTRRYLLRLHVVRNLICMDVSREIVLLGKCPGYRSGAWTCGDKTVVPACLAVLCMKMARFASAIGDNVITYRFFCFVNMFGHSYRKLHKGKKNYCNVMIGACSSLEATNNSVTVTVFLSVLCGNEVL